MDLGLEGKRAIVTGGTRGMGKAIAARLLSEGVDVMICGRNEVNLASALEELAVGARGQIEGVSADLAREEDIQRLVDAAREAYGGVDLLVINPGHPPTSFETDFGYSDDDWKTGFEQLVLSAVRLSRLTVPQMAEQKWGRVVIITTLFAREPTTGHVLSGALRACSHAFIKSLSREFASRGVTCNAILPGAIDTPRVRETIGRAESRGLQDPVEALGIPVGRTGSVDEVAATISYLCSVHAAYITGSFIAVDGGALHGM
jgi:3-oxoacyl-[acyl-carrier protein] reductase